MNELQVVVQQEPGVIKWNFEELRKELEAQLKVYETMVYDDDSISAAKSDVASLRKLRKAVEDKRKEIKNKCLEPYTVLEGQAKELCGIIDKPIAYVNKRITDYEEEQRQIRKKAIVEYLDSALSGIQPDVAKLVKENMYDTRWENKSMPVKDWKVAIDKIVETVGTDLKLIHNMDEEFQAPCLNVYKKSFSLGQAIEKQRELQEQKDRILEAERQRQEAERVRKEREAARIAEQERIQAERNARKAEEVEEETVQEEPERPKEAVHEEPREESVTRVPERQEEEASGVELFHLRITGTKDQLNKVAKYAKFVGATYEVV